MTKNACNVRISYIRETTCVTKRLLIYGRELKQNN